MKRTSRKLALRAETIRNLSTADLSQAVGGVSSARASLCSTWHDGGCATDDRCPATTAPTTTKG
jgi:hypothetical protein